MADPVVNLEVLKSDIRAALINHKAFACPIAARVAWHSAGTYDKSTGTGGSDGATMRFEPEKTDPANAGLGIVRDLLLQVAKKHPQVSLADLWTLAGALSIEWMGGPAVPFMFGRSDDASGGPWTEKPLTFDNEYFRNLVQRTWVKRDWDGPLQYEDAETGQLMMLPTDLALRDDPGFSEYVHLYARNQDVFFAHFSTAFGKLLALGCPEQCQPRAASSTRPSRCPHEAMEREEREKAVVAEASAHFREFAMHGSLDRMKSVAPVADVHAADRSSGRTALHKASFWGHTDAVRYLVETCRLETRTKDVEGETPLHDAARFGHLSCVEALIAGGAAREPMPMNNAGQTPLDLALEYGKEGCARALREAGTAPKSHL